MEKDFFPWYIHTFIIFFLWAKFPGITLVLPPWYIIKQRGFTCLTNYLCFCFQTGILLEILPSFQNGKSGQQIQYSWVVRQYQIVISSFGLTNNSCPIVIHFFFKKISIICQKYELTTFCLYIYISFVLW